MKKPIAPHITEKSFATISEEKGAVSQYTFRVPRTSVKAQIKAEVEKTYDVHVTDVRIINLPSKVRFFKGKRGATQAIKKAVVRLKAGERIAAFSAETNKQTEEAAK